MKTKVRSGFGMIDTISVFAMLVLIFSSGANMILRKIYFFAAVVLIMAIFLKKINCKAALVCFGLIAYIMIDSIVLNTATTDYKECILLTIRLVGCLVIASGISSEKFKKIYINIMIFLSILSLICFGLLLLGVTLPGSFTINNSYTTFYHVMGYGADQEVRRYRNCGIFTEPGIYQMYLNFALLALWSDKDITIKRAKKIFLLFSFTLLSTKSSMGYLIFALVLLLYFVYRPDILNFRPIKKTHVLVLFAIGMVVVGLEEINGGFVTSFITSTNSWSSRHDDTLLTLKIALDYPIFGIGLATDPLPIWDIYYYRYESLRLYRGYQNAMSCGLGNYLCMGGIPFTLLYLVCVLKSYFQLFDVKDVFAKIILFAIVLLFVLEEPLMPTPFFLIGFFTCITWKTQVKRENVRKNYNGLIN